MTTKQPTLNDRTRVDPVTTWNDENELGTRVIRYDDVRCPECDRMLWCINWECNGWPEVHCDACELRESWPFEETGLKDRYKRGPHP